MPEEPYGGRKVEQQSLQGEERLGKSRPEPSPATQAIPFVSMLLLQTDAG